MDTQQHLPLLSAQTQGDGSFGSTPQRGSGQQSGLKRNEQVMAVLVFVLWMIVFAGGILIDTRPYRLAISTSGVAALEQVPVQEGAPVTPTDSEGDISLVKAWLIVMVWFLPMNLALLCAISGALGAFGSRANLHDDDTPPSPPDSTNPYMSALLRGFFIYLIMISGLLLLDDDPFSNPTPGQYIRLAGFMSLFSFVVNYQPHVFNKLLVLAVERIQTRGGQGGRGEQADSQGTNVTYTKATAVEIATVNTPPEATGDPVEPALPGLPQASEMTRRLDKVEETNSSG